jgi:nucleoside-diphosphate-sugar epimerase
VPLNPAGHFTPETYAGIARGESLTLPNLGLETVHHVHADDVAGVVMATIEHPGAAVGESFHAVSERALSLRGFAEEMFRWFGHQPRLEFLPYEQWAQAEDSEDAAATLEHISRSPSCSMAKAQRLLDFRPRHSSLEGVQESVAWLVDNGRLTI